MVQVRASIVIVVAVILASAAILSAGKPSNDREEALKRIAACLKRDEVASKECRSLNADIEFLVGAYRRGDKSVLPTLLNLTYLTDFYDEALIADPDGFLATVAPLPETQQRYVLSGIAGQGYGVRQRERFEALRSSLYSVSTTSPFHDLAMKCLQRVEAQNAEYLVDYFPPYTFRKPSDGFDVGRVVIHWYSGEMYALGEKPLWSDTSKLPTTYRLTVIPAFSVPRVATLTLRPDGSGDVSYRATDKWHEAVEVDRMRHIDGETARKLVSLIEGADFWRLPVEIDHRGFDGAEWILEGVRDGTYHVVVRWSPDKTPFGQAAESLLKTGQAVAQ